jgi:signal transduction histidine kinase
MRIRNYGMVAVATAFVAATASFVAGTQIVESQSSRLDDAALSLAGNGLPSMRALADARATLRDLTGAVEDDFYNRVEGRPSVRAEVVEARGRLGENLDRAFATPEYEGEAAAKARINVELKSLDRAVAAEAAATDRSDFASARAVIRGELRRSSDRLARAIEEDHEANASGAAAATRAIQQSRERARMMAFVLDVACVLFTAALAVACIAVLRRNERLRSAHAALLERRADELEQFAGRIAHDVLSPLSAVGLTVEIAARAAADDRERRMLDRAQETVMRVREIVEALYEFARSGATPPAGASARVGAVVAGVVEEVRPEAGAAGVTLEAELDAGEATVSCMPGILATLTANLVRNALKHGAGRPGARVAVRAVEAGDRVRIEVQDDGPGVPEELRDLVFEPYVRARTAARTPGLGLGLATVKRVAQAHGGRVGVRAAARGGSVFWFELPRPAPERAIAPVPAPVRPA